MTSCERYSNIFKSGLLYCTMYTVHCTVPYNVHCTMYSIPYKLGEEKVQYFPLRFSHFVCEYKNYLYIKHIFNMKSNKLINRLFC